MNNTIKTTLFICMLMCAVMPVFGHGVFAQTAPPAPQSIPNLKSPAQLVTGDKYNTSGFEIFGSPNGFEQSRLAIYAHIGLPLSYSDGSPINDPITGWPLFLALEQNRKILDIKAGDLMVKLTDAVNIGKITKEEAQEAKEVILATYILLTTNSNRLLTIANKANITLNFPAEAPQRNVQPVDK